MAGRLNPFDAQDRGGSARLLGALALQTESKEWLEAARAECIVALRVDYSAADILLKLVAIDLKLGRSNEAQFFYDQFKRVDPKSPVIQYVEHHVQGSRAVAAEP